MCFEDGGMAIGPCPKLGKSVFQEYLEKREQLVVSHGDDRVEAVQCIEVKDSRYPKGRNNRVDSSRARFWRGGRERVYE
jgi:hypothetical protein